MTNRVNPTEKAMRGLASKAVERLARILCVKEEAKAKTRPKKGKPEGPGMAVVLDRGLERAHARPPGARRKAKTETNRRTPRKRGKLRTGEDSMQVVGEEDMFADGWQWRSMSDIRASGKMA